jgi:hypothetical protein
LRLFRCFQRAGYPYASAATENFGKVALQYERTVVHNPDRTIVASINVSNCCGFRFVASQRPGESSK